MHWNLIAERTGWCLLLSTCSRNWLMAGNTLPLRSWSKRLKNRLKVLWLAISLSQPNMRSITSSRRRVPECDNLVAPKMVLTIKPSARSTELYPRLDPVVGKFWHSSSRYCFNPLRRYVSSISRRPPHGETSLSVKSYGNPFILWVKSPIVLNPKYCKGYRGFQIRLMNKLDLKLYNYPQFPQIMH